MKTIITGHTIISTVAMAFLCAYASAQIGGSGRIPYTPQEQQALNNYAAMTLGSIKLSNAGDVAFKRGDLKEAQDDYQQAAAKWPGSHVALYGLGDCEQKTGDIADAITHYRAAIYYPTAHAGPPVQPAIREWNTDRLMKYVLLLSEDGQDAEAMTVYHHAVNLIDYEDGKQRIKVMLPDFGPGGLAYTPQRLQAMAHAGIAITTSDDQEELSHLQQATSLASDVPVTHFFLGRYLAIHAQPDARAEFERARQSGDIAIGVAVDRFEKVLPKSAN